MKILAKAGLFLALLFTAQSSLSYQNSDVSAGFYESQDGVQIVLEGIDPLMISDMSWNYTSVFHELAVLIDSGVINYEVNGTALVLSIPSGDGWYHEGDIFGIRLHSTEEIYFPVAFNSSVLPVSVQAEESIQIAAKLVQVAYKAYKHGKKVVAYFYTTKKIENLLKKAEFVEESFSGSRKTLQYKKQGDWKSAQRDFESLVDRKSIKKDGDTLIGSADGITVTAYPVSSGGVPSIQIINTAKEYVKIRYVK